MPISTHSAASRPLDSRTILVVDDSASIRSVLEAALSEAGAVTWLAEDGVEALHMIDSSAPDLILLDIVMPRLDGWGVIEGLHRSPHTARIPVVLQTSVEDYPSFDRARHQGVAAFIAKPFRLNEVVETCRRVFEGARPLQGAAAPPPKQVVALSSRDGRVRTTAQLIDLDSEGAQLLLAAPLPLGTAVLLGPLVPGQEPIAADVRWVTCAAEHCYVGVQLRTRC